MHSNDRNSPSNKEGEEGVSLHPSPLPSAPDVPCGTAYSTPREDPTPQIVLRKDDEGVPSARSGVRFESVTLDDILKPTHPLDILNNYELSYWELCKRVTALRSKKIFSRQLVNWYVKWLTMP